MHRLDFNKREVINLVFKQGVSPYSDQDLDWLIRSTNMDEIVDDFLLDQNLEYSKFEQAQWSDNDLYLFFNARLPSQGKAVDAELRYNKSLEFQSMELHKSISPHNTEMYMVIKR